MPDDRLLKAIADVALETLRRSDTVGRIGGDEFAVIFPETGRTEALFAVDKLQHKLLAVTRLRQWRVGFNIGVAAFDKTPGAATAAMEFADRLTYTAKESSKEFTYGTRSAIRQGRRRSGKSGPSVRPRVPRSASPCPKPEAR
jgi:diguanylate cyclase (GGDEF)-like protein